MEAGRKITRRGKKKKKSVGWMPPMPSPCLDAATFHGRLNRVQFGIKIEREKKTGDPLAEEGKNSLSLSLWFPNSD